jgi:hypothetical protein
MEAWAGWGEKAREGGLFGLSRKFANWQEQKDETKRRDRRVCKTICINLSIVSNYFANNLVC